MKSKATEQLKIGIILIVLVILIGTFGYETIEPDFDLLDSFYMSVISITTTGFKEVKPLSDSGKLFTIFLIITGVLSIAYTGGKAAQILIEKEFFRRRKMFKSVGKLKNHYIVCGYGRMGKQICETLAVNKKPFVVIEKDPKEIVHLSESEMLFIEGDATNDEVLLAGGIENAKGLVAAIQSDAENVFTTLSAKELNPDVYVVARAIEEGTESKLRKAGADRVVKPYELGGSRMVQLLLRPGVMDFIDVVARQKTSSIHLEEIELLENSKLVGKKLSETNIRRDLNIIVVGITRKDGNLIYNPKSDTVFELGDKLIVIGDYDNLETLIESNLETI